MRCMEDAARWIAAVALILINGCSGNQLGEEPAPVIRPQEGKELCPKACEAMATKLTGMDGGIGCELALPIPVQDGGTAECEPDAGTLGCIGCEEWCVEQHDNGVSWNNECIIGQISTCAEIETVCNIQ